MFVNQSYVNFQASMSFGTTGMGATTQMMALMQNLMGMLQSQLGVGRGCGGYRPAPYRSDFGSHGGCGGGPGLSNFCGNQGPGTNNINININGQPFGGPQDCQCGPRHQCGGPGQGRLQQDGKGKPINYTTRGGYQVTVDKDKVMIKDKFGNEVKQHGDPHEDVNGKHVKDWEGKQRSIILDDGTKITMSAKDAKGVTNHTSIYDGRQNVQIANGQNLIEHASMNGWDTMQRELAQYDGETARFSTNWGGDAAYYNVYNQAENGMFTRNFDPIARVRGGQVNDLYPGL